MKSVFPFQSPLRHSLLQWCLILIGLWVFPPTQAAQSVTIGIYDNPPMIQLSEQGQVEGLFADLLKDIAQKEDWNITYQHASFSELLEQLDTQEIDLMPVVAYSEDRATRYDFNRENILTNWGQVYISKDSSIRDIADLSEKKIAVLAKDIHYQVFSQLIEQFDVNAGIIETDSYHEVLKMVADKTVNAGIVNRLFGQEFSAHYGVIKNGIIFNPIKIHFAAPKGSSDELLKRIDHHLNLQKQEKSSLYFKSIHKWIGEEVPPKSNIPTVAAVILALLISAFLANLLMRLQTLRRIIGLTQIIEDKVVINILVMALIIAVIAWWSIAYVDYRWINPDGNSFDSFIYPHLNDHFLFHRLLLVGVILLGGIVVSNIISRLIKGQKQVQLSEQRFRLTTKAGQTGVWDWNLETDDLYLAPFLKEMLGYQDAEINNQMEDWTQLVHPDDRQHFRQQIEEVIGSRDKEFYVEQRMLHKNGEVRWFLAHGSIIRDDQGKALRMVGTDTDITAFKQTLESLEKSELRFRNLFDSSEVSIWDEDVTGVYMALEALRDDGVTDIEEYLASHPEFVQDMIGQVKVKHVNRATLRLFNAPNEADFLSNIQKSFGPGAINVFIASLKAQWNQETFFRSEANYVTFDGKSIQAILSYRIPSTLDEARHVAITIVDISDRKQALTALVENQVLLKEAQSMANIGNWELDAESKRAIWSEEIFSMFGIEYSSDVGLASLEGLIHVDDRKCVLESLESALTSTSEHNLEYRIVRPDGVERWVDCRAVHKFNEAGEVVSLRGVIQDITERKAAEQNLIMLKEQAEQSESKFKAITDQSSEGISVADMDGNYTFVNKAFCDMMGYREEELLQKTVFDMKAPEQDHSSFDRTKGQEEGMQVEVMLQRKDGSVFIAEVIGKVIEFAGQTQVLGTVRDITRQVKADEQIRTLSQAVEQSPVSVMITDTHARIEYVNAAFEKITGYAAEEVKGLNPRLLKSDRTQPSQYHELWEAISQGKSWQGELQNRKKNGELFWEYGHFAPVLDEEGQTRHYLAVKEDITIRKQQEEHIIHQAHYDTLTNLPNRFLVLDRLSQLMEEAKRDGQHVAVLFLDMDDFKKVNDSMGHETGDKLLVEASERLAGVIRAGDTVGRFGGDEFIVLLGGLNDSADARPVAEHLLNRFRDAFRIDDRELMITLSLGIAIYPGDGDNASDLLRNADSAMYHSKQLGRNTFSFFTDEMNRNAAHRLALEEQMHGALDRGEFSLCYQPQIDIETGQIVGAEALLRWNNPALGQVSPVEFIPIAEQTGLIVSIGNYVLSAAIEQAAKWQKTYSEDFNIAINLSPRQFRDPNLAEFVGELMRRVNINSDTVELEITEGVLLSGHSYVDETLTGLNKLGVNIAMDDFGTGYSSLSYLRRYPFDVLKIDKSFIRDISDDQADRELINATIAMAHGLNLKVVAEGVETEAQLQYLKSLKCDYAQGYLFGKPVPAVAFSDLLVSSQVAN